MNRNLNLHKDKERLRHQRQVRLLDEVMKIVPRSLCPSPSKVRKLRHLVLYYHFMQKVHAQITKGHSNIIKDSKTPAKKRSLKSDKSDSKHLMVHWEPNKKLPRANIVFLQADQSKCGERNISNETVITYNGNCPESSHIEKMEYKKPEVAAINHVDVSSSAVDYNLCLPVESIVQTHSYNSSSPGELSLQSDLASEDYYKEREGKYSSTISNFLITNSSDDHVGEQSVSHNWKRMPENIINGDNLVCSKQRKTDFQNILQDYSNNSTLTIPNTSDKNLYSANINFPVHHSNYVLQTCPIENVMLLNDESNCKPFFSVGSVKVKSQFHSLSENLTDNCSDSTLTDNLHIDIESFSDSSNEVCKMKTNACNDLNVSDSPKALIYDFPYGTLTNYDDLVLPFVSSSHNYLENYYNGQNEISFRPVNYLPHFENISRNNIIFSEIPPIKCFEPDHTFQDRLIEPRFISDNVSFYSSPLFETRPLENLTLLSSRSENFKSELDSQESSSGDNNSGLFDEEISYPISQYISNGI